jgi:hypothetical protein
MDMPRAAPAAGAGDAPEKPIAFAARSNTDATPAAQTAKTDLTKPARGAIAAAVVGQTDSDATLAEAADAATVSAGTDSFDAVKPDQNQSKNAPEEIFVPFDHVMQTARVAPFAQATARDAVTSEDVDADGQVRFIERGALRGDIAMSRMESDGELLYGGDNDPGLMNDGDSAALVVDATPQARALAANAAAGGAAPQPQPPSIEAHPDAGAAGQSAFDSGEFHSLSGGDAAAAGNQQGQSRRNPAVERALRLEEAKAFRGGQ